MKLHARTLIVQEATNELDKAVCEVLRDLDLHDEEIFMAFGTYLAQITDPQPTHRLHLAMQAVRNKHNLTTGEMLSLIGEHLNRSGKHYVRAERHPDDPHKAGDAA